MPFFLWLVLEERECGKVMQEMKMQIAGLALRTAVGGPMRELIAEDGRVAVEVDGGLVGDVPRKTAKRGVTFLLRSQWDAVMREMGLPMPLPWYERRSNVLIETDALSDLGGLMGQRIRIGEEVELLIEGETDPCGVMEALAAGLREALTPDFRGGVFGRVLVGGTIGIGDEIHAVDG